MPSLNAINIEFPCKHNASRQQLIQSGIDQVQANVSTETDDASYDDTWQLQAPRGKGGDGPGTHCSYHYTSDHAKWGISALPDTATDTSAAAALRSDADANPNIVCVGGINRMSSQQKRGGGTVCFAHEALHTYMQSLIATTQDCDVLPVGTPLKMLGAAHSILISATIVDEVRERLFVLPFYTKSQTFTKTGSGQA